MIRRARGATCGEARTPAALPEGFPVTLPAGGEARSDGSRTDASAAVPIPVASRLKKWRRVRRSRCSSMRRESCSFMVRSLSLGQGLVEVEEEVGGQGSGGERRRIERRVAWRLPHREELRGGVRI